MEKDSVEVGDVVSHPRHLVFNAEILYSTVLSTQNPASYCTVLIQIIPLKWWFPVEVQDCTVSETLGADDHDQCRPTGLEICHNNVYHTILYCTDGEQYRNAVTDLL